ncbi:isoprenylcysteine carboxylmethyltransferase family protein [Aestuariivirga sp.]|uniref:methyltransferase family protein n=1 Tax=Aestuariivirga sp. TaxID=2650926 RepID=UPI003016C5E8
MVQKERTRQILGHMETLLFVAFYGLIFFEFSRALLREPSAPNAIYLFDQTLILCFLLFRRRAHLVTERPLDFVLAAAGTLLPMLAQPASGGSVIPPIFCTALMIVGLLIHLSAKLSLRRRFGVIPAARGVKSSGAYRLVRHPMYLGYMIVELGLFLDGPQLWNAAVFALHWMLFHYRMVAEERVLRLNPEYEAYCERTRYRLVPGLY